MNRFYCLNADVSHDAIIIRDKDQVHHIKDVIRLQEGERVRVFDEQTHEFDCVIKKISQTHVVFTINGRIEQEHPHRPRITVACAIPKHSKIDDIIDKLTQIGVSRIIPLMTGRVIVKLDKQKRSVKRERWQKIALSASKQSQRNTVAQVDDVTDLKALIAKSSEYDLKLIPTLPGERRSLKDVLAEKRSKNILVLIGPEGDFTPEEVSLACNAGFIPVSFGDFVFRVETACLYIASILTYEFA